MILDVVVLPACLLFLWFSSHHIIVFVQLVQQRFYFSVYFLEMSLPMHLL